MSNPHDTISLPLYRRIHIEKRSEFSLVYRLLESYISDPKLASSVKEVVFRPKKYHGYCCESHTPTTTIWIENEASRDVSEEKLFYDAIERLDLSSAEQKKKWVKHLTWMKPDLVEERKQETNGKSGGSEDFRKFVAEQDHEFAYHATTLLLLICPNIERLVYRDNLIQNPLKQTLRRNNYGTLHQIYLEKLKEVVILSEEEPEYVDDGFYIPTHLADLLRMFHRLPSIESLSAEGITNPEYDEEFETTFPAGTSNIKKISITHSEFGSNILAALACAPKALEEFSFTTGGLGSNHDCTWFNYSREIRAALLRQKNSLIKLDLDLANITNHVFDDAADESTSNVDRTTAEIFDEWQELASREYIIDEMETKGLPQPVISSGDEAYEYGATIGPLNDFERLTHLSINVDLLLHDGTLDASEGQDEPLPFKLIDALPPSLEYLLIRGYRKGEYPRLDEHFAKFLQLKSKQLPKLKEVYGVDQCVPKGETVEYPDMDKHLLWVVKDVDQGWLKANNEIPSQLELEL